MLIGARFIGGCLLAIRRRPNVSRYGVSELMAVIVNGTPLIDALDPFDTGFRRHTYQFTAAGPTAEIRFVNRSPPGDRSVFVDDVTVCRVGSAAGVDVTTAQSSQAMCAAGW